jgi:2-hydroxy-6-oxonona-2,4-dienedioate hydrolase
MPKHHTLQSEWTLVDGLQMHARVAGRRHDGAAPVVLVHGLVVSSRYMIPTAERLAAHRQVYAPDLPGFGHSDHPARPFDVVQLAEALAGWMHARGLAGAALLANSLGCQVVAELATHHPYLASRIVLVGPTMDRHGRQLGEQARRLVAAAPYERPSLVGVQVRDVLSAGLRETVATTHYGLIDRIEAKLPRIGVPTLVVCGEHDSIAPPRWCAEVAALLPHGQLRVIPGAGHALNYSAPDALLEAVLPFLADPSRSTESFTGFTINTNP